MKFKDVKEAHAWPADTSVSRNTGEAPIKGVTAVDSNSRQDMAAFDQLGPKTRAVINSMPVKWSSHQTLQMIQKQGMHPIRHDDMIAGHLKQAADHVAKQIRIAEATMASSLRASIKVLRESSDFHDPGSPHSTVLRGHGWKTDGKTVAGIQEWNHPEHEGHALNVYSDGTWAHHGPDHDDWDGPEDIVHEGSDHHDLKQHLSDFNDGKYGASHGSSGTNWYRHDD